MNFAKRRQKLNFSDMFVLLSYDMSHSNRREVSIWFDKLSFQRFREKVAKFFYISLFLRAPNAALQSIVHSLFPNPAPRSELRAVIGWIWVRHSHRSKRPFISSLGRWTPHLISNKGNFSILQPVYSDTATNLGFYYFSWAASFFLLFTKSLLTLTGLCFTFSLWTFWVLCAQRRRQQRRALSFNKEACGSLFAFFFLDRLSFFVGAKSMGAQFSKAAAKAEIATDKPGEAAASPTKTNGQVNDILTSSSLHPSGENLLALERGAALRGRNPCVIVDRLNGAPQWEFKLNGETCFLNLE